MDTTYTPFDPFSVWGHLTVDDVLWDEACAALDRARRSSSPDRCDVTLSICRRLATCPSAVSAGGLSAAWNAAARGTTVRELLDAQLEALTWVRRAAADLSTVTETWLRRTHIEVCRPQRSVSILTAHGWQDGTFHRGWYKRLANRGHHPDGSHLAFAPAIDTPSEMRRLVGQLRSPGFADAHPVLQAAYAHYGLVRVHPFQDGNGRVARALASVYLCRATALPLIIVTPRRDDYLASLCAAVRGDRAAFVDFLFRRAVDTMWLAAESLQPAAGQAV